MSEMRVLTVRQPWATAILRMGKTVENRTRDLTGGYRGPIAIHAGLAQPGRRGDRIDYGHGIEVEKDLSGLLMRSEKSWPYRLPLGAIIGVVDLIDVHGSNDEQCERFSFFGGAQGACSDWAELGAWHFELANPRPLPHPIPFKGALGLRRLPDEVHDQIVFQLAREHVEGTNA
ncbi:hypothetical protein [Gryllotalpicola koreensis]|uniref:ASCH domain-containing protein n=1 Tax=Gryllotalpicola koreensis TaxID=993086 RepID=A0ABP8A2T6_9MICO